MDLDVPQPKNDNFPMEFGTFLDDDTIISGQQEDAPTIRRSTRERTPSWKVRENADRGEVALPAAYEVLATYFEPKIADEMMDPIAFLAKSDPDTLYYHQAMTRCKTISNCHAGRNQ
jgi:hypothetical protein